MVLANFCRTVSGGPLGVLIWAAELVKRGRRQGKVLLESSPVFIRDLRLLWIKESFKLESRRYPARTRELRKISMDQI